MCELMTVLPATSSEVFFSASSKNEAQSWSSPMRRTDSHLHAFRYSHPALSRLRKVFHCHLNLSQCPVKQTGRRAIYTESVHTFRMHFCSLTPASEPKYSRHRTRHWMRSWSLSMGCIQRGSLTPSTCSAAAAFRHQIHRTEFSDNHMGSNEGMISSIGKNSASFEAQ